MARINGVNSDYKFIGGKIEEVKPPPSPLELKLFICPTAQKNSIEAEGLVCEGQNTNCPATPAPLKNGHAMMHLHQQTGLHLVTDNNNRLQLDQAGNILLQPSVAGKVETRGNVEMKNAAGNATLVSLQNNTVIITVAGARVEVKADGSIELTPAAGKAVKVTGNLVVTGTVNGKTI